MADKRIKISKIHADWHYFCRECVNSPGHLARSHDEAMMRAEAHLLEFHPVIDWDEFARSVSS